MTKPYDAYTPETRFEAERYDRVFGQRPAWYRRMDGAAIPIGWLADVLKPASHVLDLGCGQGRNALALAEKSHHVTAVDVSTVGLDHLREDQPAASEGSILVVQEDITVFAWVEAYDAVILAFVLHHLIPPQVMTLLQRATDRIMPGGYLVIITYLQGKDPDGKFYPDTPEELLKMAGPGWSVEMGYLAEAYESGLDIPIYNVLLQRQ